MNGDNMGGPHDEGRLGVRSYMSDAEAKGFHRTFITSACSVRDHRDRRARTRVELALVGPARQRLQRRACRRSCDDLDEHGRPGDHATQLRETNHVENVADF